MPTPSESGAKGGDALTEQTQFLNVVSRDEATTKCVPLGLPGDRCATFQDCSPYLECDDASKQCRDVPRVGMACTVNCAGAAWCSKIPPNLSGTCVEPQANTSPCTANNECASFYCQEGPVFDACTDQPICM